VIQTYRIERQLLVSIACIIGQNAVARAKQRAYLAISNAVALKFGHSTLVLVVSTCCAPKLSEPSFKPLIASEDSPNAFRNFVSVLFLKLPSPVGAY